MTSPRITCSPPTASQAPLERSASHRPWEVRVGGYNPCRQGDTGSLLPMIGWREIRLHLVHLALKIRLRRLVDRSEDLVRLGSELGGWWIPSDAAKPGAVAYCAGAGDDITFDLALLRRGCKVTTFDPTPRAISHVASLAVSDPRFHFVPIGWWDTDTELQFYLHRDKTNPNFSAVGLHGAGDYVVAPVRKVTGLMGELEDDHVDIMKIDVEGAEYRVLDDLLGIDSLPGVLCVEFDQPQPMHRTVAMVRRLTAAGYRLLRIDFFNYTFDRRCTCNGSK